MDLGHGKFEAAKAFTMGGTPYLPGESVDVSQLSSYKISQLLRQRYFVPVLEDEDPEVKKP